MMQVTLFLGLLVQFKKPPDDVVNRIRATTDMDQLKSWFDALLGAETLADVGITPRE
jgi:hypothetical protein